MKQCFLFFVVSFFLAGSFFISPVSGVTPTLIPLTPVPTVDYVLPYPGILPNHPLYPVKIWRDKILLFFSRTPLKKAEIYLLLSDKRLVMGQRLWERGLSDKAFVVFSEAERSMLSGVRELTEARQINALPPGLADKFELSNKKHEETLIHLIELSEDKAASKLTEVLSITHQVRQQITTVK